MRKFVLIALVALFAVAAAQEITDFKYKNLTYSDKDSNKSFFANKTGKISNIIVAPKNLTNPWRLVVNKSASWLSKNKNFTKNITAKISNLNRPIKNVTLVGRPNRTFVVRPNKTILGRPNKTYIGRPNKTNRTNKTGGIFGGLKSWFGGSGLEDEESSEATEDFSTLASKNRTPRNRTFLKGRPNKSNRTNKTEKASKGGFFDVIKSWFSVGGQQEDEEEDYMIKNKTMGPKNKSVGLWGKVTNWFGGKKNNSNKTQPQKKNTTNVTQVQKKNISNKTQPQKNSSNKTQPQKKNTSNVTQIQKKNISNKTQPQKKNTTNVTQVQKKNISNKTQPQKNNSNKTQPKKNDSKKNQTNKIGQLELEDLAWNSDKKPTPGLLGSSLPPF